jgi:hypothetical protein
MTPDLSDDEKRALIELLTHTIEDDLYPLSPRIRTPKAILAKLEPPTAVIAAPVPALRPADRPRAAVLASRSSKTKPHRRSRRRPRTRRGKRRLNDNCAQNRPTSLRLARSMLRSFSRSPRQTSRKKGTLRAPTLTLSLLSGRAAERAVILISTAEGG